MQDCTGVGKLSCESCKGNGKITCRNCNGNGQWLCQRCNGIGFKDSDKCYSCEGLGKVRCKQCVAGYNSCTKCIGLGTLVCKWCEGAGKAPCERCGGWGELVEKTILEATNYPLINSFEIKDSSLEDGTLDFLRPYLSKQGNPGKEINEKSIGVSDVPSNVYEELRDNIDKLFREHATEKQKVPSSSKEIEMLFGKVDFDCIKTIHYRYKGRNYSVTMLNTQNIHVSAHTPWNLEESNILTAAQAFYNQGKKKLAFIELNRAIESGITTDRITKLKKKISTAFIKRDIWLAIVIFFLIALVTVSTPSLEEHSAAAMVFLYLSPLIIIYRKRKRDKWK